MDVEHRSGGRRLWVAALSSLAIFVAQATMVGCGSGDDQAVGGNSVTGTDGSPSDQAVPDSPLDVAVADVARDVAPMDAVADVAKDGAGADVSVLDAAADVAKDSPVIDAHATDVAVDASHDSSTATGPDASDAGKDVSVDAPSGTTPDTGTGVTPDTGTGMTEDAGTGVTEDAGTGVTEDAGTGVTDDAGTDTGVEVTEDAGTDSSPVTEPPDATIVIGGCGSAADCPAPTTDCQTATCTLGVCGLADRTAGAACASNGGKVCNGNGACIQCLGTNDCPATGTACKANTCIAGVCATTNSAATSACADHGGAVCDGAGACVQCLVAHDCPMQTSACRTNTCAGNQCGTSNSNAGAGCNDNGGLLCDGNGSCVPCLAASDCPAQTTACKTNTCVSHACGTTNAMLGVGCADSGGVACDGNGSCVANHCSDGVKDADETDVDCGGSCGATCTDSPAQQVCLVGGDCVSKVCGGPGPTLVCQPPSCTDNVKNGDETDVDCGGAACDGSGHACPDLAHCSANADCTHGTCFGNGLGMCVSCSDGVMDGNETDIDCGGMECDAQNRTCAAGAGCDAADDCAGSATGCTGSTYNTGATCTASHCVAGTTTDCAATGMVCTPGSGCISGCNTIADCPAPATDCIVRTCIANTCGTVFADSTVTPSAGQTTGDCQKLVCNGAGGTTQVDNTGDPPLSNTVCQVGVCSTTTPSVPGFLPAPTGTSCTHDNQPPNQVCGDTAVPAVAGTCVQCNVDADCAALSLTVCTSNVCH